MRKVDRALRARSDAATECGVHLKIREHICETMQ